MRYYTTTYEDKAYNMKVLQVGDDYNEFETPNSGINESRDFESEDDMIESAKTAAYFLMCNYLEVVIKGKRRTYKLEGR